MDAQFAQARVYADFNGLNDIKLAAKENSPEAIKEVATQFESLFLQMMLKTMREASPSDGLFASNQMKSYEEMYDKQLSMHLAERGSIGIADMLIRQLGGEAENNNDGELNDLPAPNNSLPINSNQRLSNDFDSLTKQTSKDLFSDPQSFIDTLKPIAEKFANELGVDANVLLAQAALETGWGKKIIHSNNGDSSHNLFGIKAGNAWQGEQHNVKTLEYRDEQVRQEVASFRGYDSFEQSFADYVGFIKGHSRYQDALNKVDDGPAYLKALQDAGHATDPKYAEKITDILKRSDLFES